MRGAQRSQIFEPAHGKCAHSGHRDALLQTWGIPLLRKPRQKGNPQETDYPRSLRFRDPGYLKARHDVEGRDKVFEIMTAALGKITDAVVQP